MRLGQVDSFRKLVFVKVAAGGTDGDTAEIQPKYSRRSSHEGPLISSTHQAGEVHESPVYPGMT